MLKGNNKEYDVLGTILQEPHKHKAIQGIDELTEMIERFSKPLISTEIDQKKPKKSFEIKKIKKTLHQRNPTKKKATHYLTDEVFRELDDANNFLRGLLPPGSKLLTTKSKIVNYAVKMLLNDFESNGENSKLVKKLLLTDKP